MKHTLNEALAFALATHAVGILEKDSSYQTAKDWLEIDYAEKCGWRYLGHPVDLLKKAQLPNQPA